MKILRLAIVCAAAAATTPGVAQDVKHTPTLQSCAADINLWSSQVPGFPEPSLDQIRAGLKALTQGEIDGRVTSLGNCVSAYPSLGKGQGGNLPAATTLGNLYGLETQARYLNFIYRHGMLRKFTEEDEAGQR